ncbi:hypothetical protein ABIA31_006172 [Catenulispora sp. MAP5-51]|uniref:hypothetical protein n=1 Tax=Catenulispora sp. MAP5-51 TaxID=3156298 RepID=UPI003518C3CA
MPEANLVALEFLARQARARGITDVLWRGTLWTPHGVPEYFTSDFEVVLEVGDTDYFLIETDGQSGHMRIWHYLTAAELVAHHWDYGDEGVQEEVGLVRMGFPFLGSRRNVRCVRAYHRSWEHEPARQDVVTCFVLSFDIGASLQIDAEYVDGIKLDCLPAGWSPPDAGWFTVDLDSPSAE